MEKAIRKVYAKVINEEDVSEEYEEIVGTAYIAIDYYSTKTKKQYGTIMVDNKGNINIDDFYEASKVGGKVTLNPNDPALEKLHEDCERIDKNNAWDSVRKLIKEDHLKINYSEDMQYGGSNDDDYDYNDIFDEDSYEDELENRGRVR